MDNRKDSEKLIEAHRAVSNMDPGFVALAISIALVMYLICYSLGCHPAPQDVQKTEQKN